MKKKIFNRRNAVGLRGGAVLAINPNGYISFSRDLTERLGLNKKDAGVEFIQDEDRPTDWYVNVSRGPDAIKIRLGEDGGGKIQSTFLAREMLRSMKLEGGHKMQVATEPAEPNTYAIFFKTASATSLRKAA
jgi:hypothetical protein